MTLCQRLRRETKTAHEEVERTVNLPARVSDIESYRALIARYHRFYCELHAECADAHLPEKIDFGLTQKIGWLEEDLEALSSRPLPHHCVTVPVSRTDTAVKKQKMLGYSYVLHGSMLGGKYIAKNVSAALSLDERSGCRFFYGHGEQTGTIWRDFQKAMDAVPLSEYQQIAVVAHAHECFTRFGKALAA